MTLLGTLLGVGALGGLLEMKVMRERSMRGIATRFGGSSLLALILIILEVSTIPCHREECYSQFVVFTVRTWMAIDSPHYPFLTPRPHTRITPRPHLLLPYPHPPQRSILLDTIPQSSSRSRIYPFHHWLERCKVPNIDSRHKLDPVRFC